MNIEQSIHHYIDITYSFNHLMCTPEFVPLGSWEILNSKVKLQDKHQALQAWAFP